MSKKNKKKNRSSAAKKQNTAVNNKPKTAEAAKEAAEQTAAIKTDTDAAEASEKVSTAENDKATEKASSSEKEKTTAKNKPDTKPSSKHSDHADNSHILKPAVSYAYILILFVLLIIVFILKLMGDKDLAAANERNEQLSAAILAASENIAQLTAENAEQKKQLDAMSTAINARTELNETQKKEEEESALPILYPVKGTAVVITDPISAEEGVDADENLMRFLMDDGASVLATGSGLVEVLSDDGDGFVNIVIDHGNGYKSRYVGEGTALCEAGKEVKRGDLIMLFTENDSEFTYSILQNGKTVDPMSVMVIDG